MFFHRLAAFCGWAVNPGAMAGFAFVIPGIA
jgi:hypothetical protein